MKRRRERGGISIQDTCRWKRKKTNKKWGENSQAEQIESALPWVPGAGIIMQRGGWKQIVGEGPKIKGVENRQSRPIHP